MLRTDSYRRFFLFAAAFNLAIAGLLSLFPGQLFPLLGMPAPLERVTLDLFSGAVALFGVQFSWIAHRPAECRDLIALGAIGKTAVFAIIAWHWIWVGDATGKVFALAVVDLAFGAAFVFVLWRLRHDD